VFGQKCAGCHGADGQGKVGPALKGTSLTEDQIVDLLTHPQHAHSFAYGLKLGRQQDADGFVLHEAIVASTERHGTAGADLKRLLQSGNDFVLGQIRGVAVFEGIVGFLEDLGELGGGQGAREETQGHREQRKALKSFHGRQSDSIAGWGAGSWAFGLGNSSAGND